MNALLENTSIYMVTVVQVALTVLPFLSMLIFNNAARSAHNLLLEKQMTPQIVPILSSLLKQYTVFFVSSATGALKIEK